MKNAFKIWLVTVCLLVVTGGTAVGLAVSYDHNVQNQEVAVESSVEAEAPVVVEAPKASEVIVAAEVPKLCKDESGAAKACDNEDLLKHLMASVGGFSGMSALAIAFFISKLLMLLLLSPFFTNLFPSLLKGEVKLTVAIGLNLIVGVLGLMIPPVSLAFGAALMHSSTLTAFSIAGNQAFKQYLTSKGKS